jgi:hypothetical protein
MNDASFAQAQEVVERCLQSVSVSNSRKARMRDELLAHILAVFEAECHKRGDETLAIEATLRRFGDTAEIADDLRASITAAGYVGWLRDHFFFTIMGFDMFDHNRVYNILIFLLGLFCLSSAAFVLFLMGLPIDARPHTLAPQWSLPVMAVINGVYLLAITATLAIRLSKATVGKQFTKIMNWLFLVAPPFGTALGMYGLFVVDRDRRTIVAG